MAAVIRMWSDYTAANLRRFAARSGDPAQIRRLLAVVLILDGASGGKAAKVAGATLQIVRDCALRLIAHPHGPTTRNVLGKPQS